VFSLEKEYLEKRIYEKELRLIVKILATSAEWMGAGELDPPRIKIFFIIKIGFLILKYLNFQKKCPNAHPSIVFSLEKGF